jgi:hypothetical protein
MKVLRVKISHLRNEEWFQLFTEFKDLAEASGVPKLGIEALFVMFLVLYGQADVALDFIRKSLDTDLMEVADMKRDRTFRGLADAIRSALNHFVPEKKRAAEEINVVVEHFGNLSIKSGNEETAGIYNLTQMLLGEYADRTELLNLTDWVEELKKDNIAYETLVRARNDEVVSRTKFRMKAVRKETDTVYRQMVERIEAQMVIEDSPVLENFVNKLNGFLKRYSDVIAMRHGDRKAKNED